MIVYSSVICGFCRAARRLLDQKGWDYTVLGVDGNAGRRREMMDLSGGHTVPQIFFGQHHIGGFDDIAALEAAGELDALYDEYIKGA
ncbi:MAG: glutaredoxin [Gammaproteobacteria bacterium]|nr:MAG: glutaredoxin [Gammaproteobacteria bacterium]